MGLCVIFMVFFILFNIFSIFYDEPVNLKSEKYMQMIFKRSAIMLTKVVSHLISIH